MAAASKLAGYSLAQADLLRRAMGKKDKKTMAKERNTFIE
jgi:DNA polymerase-3 subunit alpha